MIKINKKEVNSKIIKYVFIGVACLFSGMMGSSYLAKPVKVFYEDKNKDGKLDILVVQDRAGIKTSFNLDEILNQTSKRGFRRIHDSPEQEISLPSDPNNYNLPRKRKIPPRRIPLQRNNAYSKF